VTDVAGPWPAVDRLLDRATIEGIVAHKLGPLAARRLRQRGRPVPPYWLAAERAAALASRAAIPLLERIRASCDQPLLVLKGPEVALFYPERTRQFSDIDILTTDAPAVHRALIAAGFGVAPDEDGFDYTNHHHEAPLKWPTIWLRIEVHARPNWPLSATPPSTDALFAAAQPSRLGVDGILAPDLHHHALLLAAHAWRDEPLHGLRQLLDVAAVTAGLDERELARTAIAFGLDRVWNTTTSTVDSLFYGQRRTVPLRSWARHLPAVRERTILEGHAARWVSGFWELPPGGAAAQTARVIASEVAPAPGERWRDKLARMSRAIRSPLAPVTRGSADRLATPAAELGSGSPPAHDAANLTDERRDERVDQAGVDHEHGGTRRE
jgi:hypothetical protein